MTNPFRGKRVTRILQLTYPPPPDQDPTALEVRITEAFEQWFAGVKDRTTKMRIQIRIDRLSCGNFGSHRGLARGIGELKLDFGPGYRLYYTRRNKKVILLCGGKKATQAQDVVRAARLAARLEEE